MKHVIATFLVKGDLHTDAIDVAARYAAQPPLWIVQWTNVVEIHDAAPSAEYRPYAMVEKWDGAHWSRRR